MSNYQDDMVKYDEIIKETKKKKKGCKLLLEMKKADREAITAYLKEVIPVKTMCQKDPNACVKQKESIGALTTSTWMDMIQTDADGDTYHIGIPRIHATEMNQEFIKHKKKKKK